MNAARPAPPTSLLLGIAAVGLALASGCASVHEVSIESVCRPAPATAHPVSYRLATRSPVLDEHSLRYKEAAGHVRTALSGHGFYEAPAGATPDLVVEIDYGIEQPRMHYKTVMEPVYLEVSNPSSSGPPTRRTIVGRPPRSQPPTADEPQLALIGYTEVPRPYFTREKYLSVTAHESRTSADRQPAPDLWRVQASIEDETDDIRRCLPVLAAAVMKQLGGTTDGTVVARVREHDADIAFIRRGL